MCYRSIGRCKIDVVQRCVLCSWLGGCCTQLLLFVVKRLRGCDGIHLYVSIFLLCVRYWRRCAYRMGLVDSRPSFLSEVPPDSTLPCCYLTQLSVLLLLSLLLKPLSMTLLTSISCCYALCFSVFDTLLRRLSFNRYSHQQEAQSYRTRLCW